MANGSGYSAGNLEFTVKQVSTEALTSLDNLIAKLKTTNSLLGSTSSISKKLSSATGRTSSGGASFNKKSQKETNKELKVSSVTISKMLNKVYFLRNYTKQMFASMKQVLSYAIEYTETLNLWQVAMRNNRQEADEFVKTMNKAYGISTQTLMNYQAIFRNMLSSLGGISENTSYALSEFLTQMAIDYASLYNTSIERAMTTFQAVLSGQVRPIRSIAGYDITETTISQLYQQLGGTKTMRQLTQTEKRLLRIYAVFQQMESSGAIGDLNRTLGNTANQMRIMSEASKELQTWFGLIMEDIFKPALPIINAFLITLTNITKAIAKMRGVQLFEGGAVESVKELNSELDNIQGKLLSFDRFEALNSSEDSGSNLLGIDESLLNGLSRYSSILSEVTGEAQELAKTWTKWWVDSETGELSKNAQNVLNIVKALSVTLATIIGMKVSTKILSLIGDLNTGIPIISKFKSGITGIKDAIALLALSRETGLSLKATAEGVGGVSSAVMGLSKVLGFITSPLGIILTIIGVLYTSNEDFRDSINDLFKALSPLITLVATLLTDILKPITPLLTGLVDIIGGTLSYAVKALTVSLNLGMLQLIPFAYALEFILKIVQSLVQLLGDLASFDWGSIGKNQKGIWSNWKSSEFAKSSLGNLKSSVSAFKTGGLVEDGIFTMNKGEMFGEFDDGTTVVANNQQIISGIQQGVYSAVVSAMRQSGNGGVGDVILDGRKVGYTTAKYSHQENVRSGYVKATR